MFATRRSGEAVSIVDALAGLGSAVSAGHGIWDLSKLGMTPEYFTELLSRLPKDPPSGPWGGAVTLDLTENRLGGFKDWSQLVAALAVRPWLCVRLGCEVMPWEVKQALVQDSKEHMWDTQVCLDRPWEDPSNKQLREAISAANRMAADIKSARQAAACEEQRMTEAVAASTTKYDSSTREGVSVAWAQQMAAGLAAELEQGEIVAVNYQWRHSRAGGVAGGMGCLVTGLRAGVPVVVIGEASFDLVSNVDEALRQLEGNVTRWAELRWKCGLLPLTSEDEEEGETVTEHDVRDIKALRLAALGDRQLCLAVGGAYISPRTMERIECQMCIAHSGQVWFSVTLPECTVTVKGGCTQGPQPH